MNKDNTLICPNCHEIASYLHHTKIETFDRTEDADLGIHYIIENGNLKTDSSMYHNPSPRRDGILIHFHCEMCHKKSTLAIVQHKGETYMEWL